MLDYKGFSLFLPRFYKFLRREPREVLEPLLLFCAFFLPGYLFQNREVDPLLFNSAEFHFMYLVQTLPLILLTLFILSRKSPDWRDIYSIRSFRLMDIPAGILFFLSIWVVLIPYYIFESLLFAGQPGDSIGVGWQLTDAAVLPFVLITCLTTGYWEELFFRAYLDKQLRKIYFSPTGAAVTVTFLFAGGHLYQGLVPALGTALIGGILLIAFRHTGRLHAVAIAHGLYNFSVLGISLFFP